MASNERLWWQIPYEEYARIMTEGQKKLEGLVGQPIEALDDFVKRYRVKDDE